MVGIRKIMIRNWKQYSKEYNLQELPSINEFSRDQLKFLGHIYIINKDGVRADPAKIQAILDLPPPSNIPQMR